MEVRVSPSKQLDTTVALKRLASVVQFRPPNGIGVDYLNVRQLIATLLRAKLEIPPTPFGLSFDFGSEQRSKKPWLSPVVFS